MKTLKPFHESVLDAFSRAIEKFQGYLKPSGAFGDQPLILLEQNLGIIIDMIEDTIIPKEKMEDFILSMKNMSKHITDQAKIKGYYDTSDLKEKFEKVIQHLQER